MVKNVVEEWFYFMIDVVDVVKLVDVVFIVVGILICCGDGYVDLLYVYVVVEEIVGFIDGFIVIVMKFIVLVGMGDEVEVIICKVCLDVDFVVVFNFEFLCEGVVIEDFKCLDCVVVGMDNEKVVDVMCEFYWLLYLNEMLILVIC